MPISRLAAEKLSLPSSSLRNACPVQCQQRLLSSSGSASNLQRPMGVHFGSDIICYNFSRMIGTRFRPTPMEHTFEGGLTVKESGGVPPKRADPATLSPRVLHCTHHSQERLPGHAYFEHLHMRPANKFQMPKFSLHVASLECHQREKYQIYRQFQ